MAGCTAADAKTPLKLKKVVLTEDQLNLVCSDHNLSCLFSFLCYSPISMEVSVWAICFT
jgi:hypothetical protein